MRKMRHKVQINVADYHGNKQAVVSGTTVKIPQRILKMLFGELTEVMVITPGRTVEGIEIKEVGGGMNAEHE